MASVPLTQQHLESHLFERVDRRTIVDSYLREQNRHVYAFANQGKELALTPEDKIKAHHPDPQPEMYGFGTPILKPRRVSQRQRDGTRVTSSIALSAPRREDPAPDPKTPTCSVRLERMEKRSSKSRRKQSPPPASKKSIGKRGVRDENSDPDRETRLAERRERKRTKRDITRRPRTPASENDRSHVDEDEVQPKVKMKQGKKQSLLGGLALLHGFTAKNIGKNRLTLKPPINLGVFNKGKASAKLQVKRRSSAIKGPLDLHFSEAKFLNPTRPNSFSKAANGKQAPSCPQSDSTEVRPSSSPVEEIPSDILRKSERLKASTIAPTKKRRACSEVWDLELESDTSTLPRSVHSSKNGTVVLNTRGLFSVQPRSRSMDGERDKLTRSMSNEKKSLENTSGAQECITTLTSNDVNSSPSIRPSQSASQSGRRHEQGQEIVSKYFFQHNEPTLEAAKPPKISQVVSMVSPGPVMIEGALQDLSPGSPPKAALGYDGTKFSIPKPTLRVRSRPVLNSVQNLHASSPDSLQRVVQDLGVEHDLATFPLNTVEAFQIDCLSDFFACYDCDDEANTYPNANDKRDPIFDAFDDGRHSLELPSGLRTNDHRSNGPIDDYDVLSQLDELEVEESLTHPQAPQDAYTNDYEVCSIQDSTIGHSADSYWLASQQVATGTRMNSRPGTGSTSSGSDSDSQNDAPTHLEQFCQGRTLLHASGRRGMESMLPVPLSQAEADVAKNLKGHWQRHWL